MLERLELKVWRIGVWEESAAGGRFHRLARATLHAAASAWPEARLASTSTNAPGPEWKRSNPRLAE